MAKKKSPRSSVKQRADGRYACVRDGLYFYGSTSEEAWDKRAAYDEEKERARILGLQQKCPTVAEYSRTWLPIHKADVAQRTYNDYQTQLNNLTDDIGDLLLVQVRPSDIKAIYSRHYIGKSNSTIKRARMIYTALFESAVSDGYIRGNPCRDKTAKPHKGSEGSHRNITEYERELILTTQHHFRPAVLLMLYAGLRRGEALALDVTRDVDFNAMTLSVTRAVSYLSNQPIIKQPKTGAGVRTVPLFGPLSDELATITGPAVKSRTGKRVIMSESSFSSAWASYVTTIECRINGYGQKRWYGKTKKDKAILSAGGSLPPWQEFTVRPHDLRHSFCVMLRDAGVDMKQAMEWMGHEDEKMILKIYDHITAQRRKKSINQVQKWLSDGQTDGQG